MLILAIEQSSDTGSAAIINDGKIIGDREWNSVNSRGCGLFKCLKKLIASAGINLKDIDRYIVDVGPGSYGGLRSSLAAVKAFAMPDKKPVYALTAPETIAFEIMQEASVDTVQVVGDARRRQLWTCVYKSDKNIPVINKKLCLVPENDLRSTSGAVIVSPDWHRLEARLKALVRGDARLINDKRIPKAACLGILACKKMELNMPSEPLCPVYMHAAVNEK
ncbi:tRNA (adenosine(37)-N6)-threonylcarbamoyltransferase complex dimerization subunit type 1 TsaB [Verrucomicrobiota bacterium]